MDITEDDEIRICTSHQKELRTPLIWTFAFPGAEYWCPYCGKNEGMLGAGEIVKSTPTLRNLLKRFKKLSKAYLDARAFRCCDQLKHDGKWIKPDQLPQEIKDQHEKAISEWRYKQKPPKINK